MEGNAGRIYRILMLCVVIMTGCVKQDPSCLLENHPREISATIEISWDRSITKAAMPDEDKVTDISLMIFDDIGHLERDLYLKGDKDGWNGNVTAGITLLRGMKYTICACANFGYKVSVSHISKLEDISYHMAYPDEYREGIPMYAYMEDVVISEGTPVNVYLERLMAKIDISLDRSMLSEDVSLEVTGVRIGNCPKKVSVFQQSCAEDEDDCFAVGFSHKADACYPLNKIGYNGKSEVLSLYMLENMQGIFSSPPITSHTQKLFRDNDARNKVCSYIEMDMEYSSDTRYSASKPLTYRFYLGDGPNSLDIERNCLYRITVAPQDDGLKGSGWRVDKSGISYKGTPYLYAYPSGYIRGDIGDEVHIWCEVWPPDTPFDVGLKYMTDDREKGIYDFRIDEDGHGATLTLKGPGSGLIYMEAGAPVNDAALFVIEVNLPQVTGSI